MFPSLRTFWILFTCCSLGLLDGCEFFFRSSEPEEHSPTFQQRQLLPPAASAEEWLERWEQDLRVDRNLRGKLPELYAELPPEDQWPALFDELRLRLDAPRFGLDEEETAGMDFSSSESIQSSYRLFMALLEKDGEVAVPLLQERLLDLREQGQLRWHGPPLVEALRLIEDDEEKTRRWVGETLGGIPENESSYWESEPSELEQALAGAHEDEAGDILVAAIEEAAGSDKALNHISSLFSLADYRQDDEQAAQALDYLHNWIDEADPELLSEVSFYPLETLLYVFLEQGDEQRLESVLDVLDETRSPDRLHPLRLRLLHRQGGNQALLERVDELAAGSEDLVPLLNEFAAAADWVNASSLGELVVGALNEEGRIEEAWSVAAHLVAWRCRYDRFYQLAREMDAEAFEALLDRLREFDPLEERPLIWQARLALEAEDIATAREHVEAAIALDPSDGDQGPNSRMEAYSILARVFEAEGDKEQARFFDEVVLAIRKGERADILLGIGLIERATELYEEALGRFEDAYCLQSRLAMTLARQDRFEEALPHFRKAFELMPVSFGPRESHCFGCEGIFDDERVQPVALEILERFREENPDNARAPYLLGQVFQEMDRDADAIKAYEVALELDPDYYNAGQKLLSLYQKDLAHAEDAYELRRRLLEFAPYPELKFLFQERVDLRQAWMDAGDVGPSPLDLPAWPWTAGEAVQQYRETDQYSSSSRSGAVLDGWSRDKLLRDNKLLHLFW